VRDASDIDFSSTYSLSGRGRATAIEFSLAMIRQRCAANDSCPPEFTMNPSTVITQFVAYATTVANIRRELLAIPGMRQAAEPVHQAAEQFYERALAYAAHALEVCVDALDDAYMEACDQATSREQIPALVDLKLDAWRRAGRCAVVNARGWISP
jgi:hypothetical protein